MRQNNEALTSLEGLGALSIVGSNLNIWVRVMGYACHCTEWADGAVASLGDGIAAG